MLSFVSNCISFKYPLNRIEVWCLIGSTFPLFRVFSVRSIPLTQYYMLCALVARQVFFLSATTWQCEYRFQNCARNRRRYSFKFLIVPDSRVLRSYKKLSSELRPLSTDLNSKPVSRPIRFLVCIYQNEGDGSFESGSSAICPDDIVRFSEFCDSTGHVTSTSVAFKFFGDDGTCDSLIRSIIKHIHLVLG